MNESIDNGSHEPQELTADDFMVVGYSLRRSIGKGALRRMQASMQEAHELVAGLRANQQPQPPTTE